jgi:hypothetical protein
MRLHNCRNGRSVTPAMGATNKLLRKMWGPMAGVEMGMKLAVFPNKGMQKRLRKPLF